MLNVRGIVFNDNGHIYNMCSTSFEISLELCWDDVEIILR